MAWGGRRGPTGGASSSSLWGWGDSVLPPPPSSWPAERAFGGLSNCLRGPLSPLPAAVTARFLPARRALRRRARAGRGARPRRYGTGQDEPIRRFISGWRGRHFVRAAIKAARRRPARSVAAGSVSGGFAVRRPRSGSRRPHADLLLREARPAAAATARGGRGSC